METDGDKVIPVFQETEPDICVLDIMLPNRNGFELAEDIRKLNDDVPIVFLTAKTQTDDVVKGFKLGGNDYIRKPFSMEELIVRIENLLRVKKENTFVNAGEFIQLGKYQFHLNKQVLSIGSFEKNYHSEKVSCLNFFFKTRTLL